MNHRYFFTRGDIESWRETPDAEQIEREIKRIQNLPRLDGWFTLLHHRGPVLEFSNNVMDRVNFILRNKPLDEILTRLRNIYYVTPKQQELYLDMALALEQAYMTALNGPTFGEYRSSRGRPNLHDPAFWRLIKSRLPQPLWDNLEKVWLKSVTEWTSWNGQCIFPESSDMAGLLGDVFKFDGKKGLWKSP